MSLMLDRIVKVPQNKSIVVDTSHILSNEKPFDYPNNKIFITQGVIDELYKLSFDEDEGRRGRAKRFFNEATERMKNGDIYYIKSTVRPSKTSELSAIDENVIHVAQWLPNSVIFSNDLMLCQTAQKLGLETYSIRTVA